MDGTSIIQVNEEALIKGLQAGSTKALSTLYENYSAALFGVICRLVNDDHLAEDILQEAFVKIWKNVQTYEASKGRLFTWMLNIARNASIDEVRSKSYKDSKKNQSLPENVDIGVPVNIVTDEIGLRKLLTKLKDEWRILVDLSYFQGFTHEEISKALDISLGTVKTRIRAALFQLRTMIS